MVTCFSPAKLNLLLAIVGRRPDGFHNLISIAAPLSFGDDLGGQEVEPGGSSQFTMQCDDPDVPIDRSNLVLRAAEAYAEATGWKGCVHFHLLKRTPMGAGLGGGSSNAVAALRVVNEINGDALDDSQLLTLAVKLGSDCPLFMLRAPVMMRGRGDRVELLPPAIMDRVRGRLVLVFKPSFGVPTPWAYRRMVERGTDYIPIERVERRIIEWSMTTDPIDDIMMNNMEPAVFEKYVPLYVGATHLKREFGVSTRMSGSGSACYIMLARSERPLLPLLKARIKEYWGDDVFLQDARVL